MIRNRQKTITVVSLLLTLVFLIMLITANAFSDELGDMAPPTIYFSMLLLLSGIVVTLMFWKRSRMIVQAVEKKNFIARWKFPVSEWERYVEHKYRENRSMGKNYFFFFSSIITFIFTFVFIRGNIKEHIKMAMFITMLVLFGILSFFAFIYPIVSKKLNKAEGAEVLILPSGILLNKQFHSWHQYTSRLVSVEIKEKPFKHLEVVYSYVTKSGDHSYTVFVPVPESADAEGVVERLKKENRLK